MKSKGILDFDRFLLTLSVSSRIEIKIIIHIFNPYSTATNNNDHTYNGPEYPIPIILVRISIKYH